MFDVITVGSATVDAFANTERTGRILIETTERKEDLIFYPSGEKLLLNKLNFCIGGGGTNTAVAMSRLGLKTAFIGKIGTKNNSAWVLKELRKDKVNTSLVIKCQQQTGYSVILDARGKDRTVLAFKGANNTLRWSEINKNKLKTKWFYFSAMLEEALQTQIKLSEYAEQNGIKIAYNISSYLARQGPKLLGEILKRTEVLILNKCEAEQLLGLTGNHHEPENLLKELLKLGPKHALITDGKNGAYTIHEKKFYTVKPCKVKVVEATGAGDAFASTYITCLIKKIPIKEALQLATVNSASVIQYIGAKNILLTMREAKRDAKKYKPKVIVKRIHNNK